MGFLKYTYHLLIEPTLSKQLFLNIEPGAVKYRRVEGSTQAPQ